MTLLAPLARRDFRVLLLAHGGATVAQLALTLAVGVHVLAATTSGIWVSLTVALSFAPYVVFSVAAGVLADRVSRSRVLAGSAVVRAVGSVAVALAIVVEAPPAAVVALTALVATAATPSYPALAAATPECVGDEELPAANALVTCVENMTWMLGAGAFGLLSLLGLGPSAAVLVAAVLFGVTGAAAGRVRTPAPARSDRPTRWWRDLRAGVSEVVRRPAVRRPMALAVLDNFLYGYLVVAFVLLAGDARLVGWLNAALSGGALASMLVVRGLTDGSRTGPTLVVTLIVFCLSVGGLGLVGPTALGLALVGVAGASTLVAEVAAVTLLQREADSKALARVFGVYDQLNVGAIALGSLVAGPLSEAVGARAALAMVGGAGLLLAGGGMVGARPRRAIDSPPCPAISSSSLPSTSRAVAPSSWSRA